MRKISIVSLFSFLVCMIYNSPASFAGVIISDVTPNAVKVECVNLTGRTQNKLIDICCVDEDFNLTDNCLGGVAPPFNPENAARTCLAGMFLVFVPTFAFPCADMD